MSKPLINLLLVPLNEDTPCFAFNTPNDIMEITLDECFKYHIDEITYHFNYFYFNYETPPGVTYLNMIKGVDFTNSNVLNNDWFKDIAFNNEVNVLTIGQTPSIQSNLHDFLKQDLPGYKGLRITFNIVN